ncbi:MAG: U32 family peptidase [Clostridiales bacterium]|nr:U32 family peptidase [Clostridiales bacterium]
MESIKALFAECELLAPSGNMECLEAAFNFGADAAYVGGPQLQLRAQSASFNGETLARAVEYAHSLGKKIYVTVNCFAKNGEIDILPDYARFLNDIGADAAIVSDLGAIKTIKDNVPSLPVHISTQANCTNYATARIYHDMGAERVVLARELTLEEIGELRQKTPKSLELEAFVHGAMCMSYSGRCLISSYLTGRSGNRGECTQPCRWEYALTEAKRHNTFIPIEEDERGTAILSSHDLNTIRFLDEIARAGVTSFKIEGRMKTAYYVGTVVNAYRMRMDGCEDIDMLYSETEAASHRPFAGGFYYGEVAKNTFNDGAYRQDCMFCGLVKDVDGEYACIEMRNRFGKEGSYEILTPGNIIKDVNILEIINSKGNLVEEATLPSEIVRVKTTYPLKRGDILRKRL